MRKQSWLIFIVLVLLSPLGLLPSGTAWGEWEPDEIKEAVGFVPQGMEELKDFWQALFPDYSMPFLGDGGFSAHLGYILSALIGSVVIYGVFMGISRFLLSKNHQRTI